MSYGSPCMNCNRVGEVGCPCRAAMDIIKQEARETGSQHTKTLREYAAALYWRSMEKNLIQGEPWGPEPIGLLNQEEVDTLSDLVQCKVMGSYDNPRKHINVLTQEERDRLVEPIEGLTHDLEEQIRKDHGSYLADRIFAAWPADRNMTQTESNNLYVGKTQEEIAASYHTVMHEVLTNRTKGKGTLVDVNLNCTPCD